MAQAQTLVNELKKALRESGITYADVAVHLQLSEASVKRLFSRQTFSLERMERTLELLRMDFHDLVERVNSRREYVSQLTPEQEEALVGDTVLLVITFLVLNRWRYDEIRTVYDFEENLIQQKLIRLDRLRMIELLPFNRYRLLTARNFTWRRNGPVQNFFATRVQTEFFDSAFDQPEDELRFVGGMLSEGSITRMHEAIDRLSQYFDELVEKDSRLPMKQRIGCSGVFAIRPLQFSMFSQYQTGGDPQGE
ncbi:MAG: helix-turn-helix transcriptional regulator [Gammaproteobacteria bacterium]|nr:helix-turn-helix transcriptional regulator [Gammaproteobacteria bacterium]